MEINGQKFQINDTMDTAITVPDSFVVAANKIGTAHGEGKFYMSSKDKMREFYGGEGFNAKCFILKKDLEAYLNAMQTEYLHPSQHYRNSGNLPKLWKERKMALEKLPDVIEFNIHDQVQIKGARGYVNSADDGYNLIRELSLPLVSYVAAMKLTDKTGSTIFYWKLFADFDAITDKANAFVYRYGKKDKSVSPAAAKRKDKRNDELRKARIGQGAYREKLLNECPFCPITMINDERLLIASHIKPWAVSTDKERLDPKNGFMLSPLYDKLFDRGFITFTDERRVIISNWLSPHNKKRIGLKDNDFFQLLPIDAERKLYLSYHRDFVFKG